LIEADTEVDVKKGSDVPKTSHDLNLELIKKIEELQGDLEKDDIGKMPLLNKAKELEGLLKELDEVVRLEVEEEVGKLERELGEKRAEMEKLEKETQKKDEEMEALKKVIGESVDRDNERKKNAENEIRKKGEEIQRLEDDAKKKEDEIESLKKELENIEVKKSTNLGSVPRLSGLEVC
jgi:chromosome segregation ATPase